MCQLTLAFRGLILARPINSSILRVGLYDICKAKPCQGSYVLLNGPFYLFLLLFPTPLLAVLHSKLSLFTQKIGIQTTMGSTPRRASTQRHSRSGGVRSPGPCQHRQLFIRCHNTKICNASHTTLSAQLLCNFHQTGKSHNFIWKLKF